jgi:uncharacterized membrane protein
MNRKPGIVATIVSVLYMLAIWVWAYTRIPANAHIAVNFDMTGRPTAYGGRWEALLALLVVPGAMLLSAGLFALIPAIEPRRLHLALSGRAYSSAWIVVAGALAAMQTVTLAVVTRGNAFGYLPQAVGVVAGVTLVVAGNYLGKTRSNFVLGIKTPWTLSSELSWARTHRLGGRLFILLGVLAAAAGWLGLPELIAVLIAGSIAIVVVLFAYSYRVWRADPSKQAVGR